MKLRSGGAVGALAALLAVLLTTDPSPVADAAERDDLVTVQALLANGADVRAARCRGVYAPIRVVAVTSPPAPNTAPTRSGLP